MFRDGTLAVLIAKYSYFGLDDTWASYQRIEEEKRIQWMTWAGSGIVCALGVTLWLAGSLRERKRVEAALRQSEARFRALPTRPRDDRSIRFGRPGHFFNKTWLDFTGARWKRNSGTAGSKRAPDDRDHTGTV
jgi:hypothetical protein